MPKAKTQENKENAPEATKAAQEAAYKLEEGKGDEDTGDEDDDDEDDEDDAENKDAPVRKSSFF